MNGLGAAAMRGAVAGAVATAPMTAFMLLTRKRGKTPEIEPRVVEKWVVDVTGTEERLSEPQEMVLAWVGHVAYGATAGAGYGVMQAFLPVPALPAGMAFGVGVWAASYAGWMPALRILPPPTQEPRETTARRVAMHLIYGGVMGAVYAVLRRRGWLGPQRRGGWPERFTRLSP